MPGEEWCGLPVAPDPA